MDPFYEKKLKGILKSFEKNFKRARGHLVRRFDEATADRIHDDTVEQIRLFVPELPDVGGKDNQFIQVVLLNAWFIPFFRASREHGMSAQEYIRMIAEVLHAGFSRCPRFIRHAGGMMVQSGLFVRRMKKRAAISQQRRYPKDWVYLATSSDDNPDVLLRVEYSQCTACLMMQEFDAVELMQYCNVADFMMAKALGFGFENPDVLGRGAGTCVGLFRRDSTCRIPDYLEFAFEGLEFQ